MHRLALPVALVLALLAGPALADLPQGRWECIAYGATPAQDPTAKPAQPPADAPIDPSTGKPIILPAGIAPDIPHGLLTIYGGSYSYASATPGDPLSGDGDAVQQDGQVSFTDGPLKDAGNVAIGKIDDAAGPLTMELIGETGTQFTCTAR